LENKEKHVAPDVEEKQAEVTETKDDS